MEFGITKALRRLSMGMDFVDCYDDADTIEFTLGTSKLKCVKTREATNEIGGFAQYCYLTEDPFVVVDRSHRFSLRRNRKEQANCFISTTEIYMAILDSESEMMELDKPDFKIYHPITFSETEDPRIVGDGDQLFVEPPSILQIFAECRLLGDRVELQNIQVLHESLFEMNNIY